MSSRVLITIEVGIVVVLLLFFLLRDQGKDDKKNQPGMMTPYSVTLG
jgi:hypothetical protein